MSGPGKVFEEDIVLGDAFVLCPAAEMALRCLGFVRCNNPQNKVSATIMGGCF